MNDDTTSGIEQAAWDWLDQMVTATSDEHPADIAYSADQMIDAWVAGHLSLHQSTAPLLARIEELEAALKPFAVIGAAIHEAARDKRWLDHVLFYAGTDDDPSKMSLTGRAFDRARAALTENRNG